MASVNISIKKEAYEFLKDIKSDEKSFSDVILSFKKEEKGVMRFFGALKDADWKAKESEIKSFRESFNRRLEK